MEIGVDGMEYIGKIEHDRILRESGEEIVVFGAGRGLDNVVNKLDTMGVKDRIVCICDNNNEKQGEKVMGIEICSPEFAFENYSKAAYIVYNQFCIEICKQLLQEKIDKIHLIRTR